MKKLDRLFSSPLNLLLSCIVLICFSFMVLLIMNLGVIDFTPSRAQAEFVKTCGELNGKEFNYKNVSTLHGQCYVPCGEQCVTVRDCQEKDITSHLRSSSSGELKIVGGYDNAYNKMSISQKSVDGAWSCSIELQDGKIRAVPSFFYD